MEATSEHKEATSGHKVLKQKMVEFDTINSTAKGYIATPESGSGAGVLVIQEWWGLVPQITGVCDLLAAEGFIALAPDLYQGEIAEHTEMDKANDLMTSLSPEKAARDMSSAVDFLISHDACSSSTVGVVGFCMGGLLALRIATLEGERISAAAPFYGAPLGDDTIDWSNLSAMVEGHFALQDDFFPPDACSDLEAKLVAAGKKVTFHFYPAGHAFGNWENPLGTYDEHAWRTAWERTVSFLRDNIL